MSETVTPKPGDPTLYAQTAKTHAKLATATLAALNKLTDTEETGVPIDPINVIVARPEIVAATAALTSAHALASLAYTQLNPPPRRFRPRPAGWTNTTRPQAGER